jgi:hypothetical protein
MFISCWAIFFSTKSNACSTAFLAAFLMIGWSVLFVLAALGLVFTALLLAAAGLGFTAELVLAAAGLGFTAELDFAAAGLFFDITAAGLFLAAVAFDEVFLISLVFFTLLYPESTTEF